MDVTAFVSAFLGAGFASSVVGVVVGLWLQHRLTIERDKESEARARREKVRQSSSAIADILSEWVRPTYLGAFSNEERWRIQSAYWRGILTLDKELVELLIARLANTADAVGSNELIVSARRVLLGLAEPDLRADQLNNWPPEAK